MSKKQPRVPETREASPNREQRRHPERAEDEPLTREAAARQASPKRGQVDRRGPQDVTDARTKSSGHKKKTADNWNQ